MIDYFSYQFIPPVPEDSDGWFSIGFLFKPIGTFDVNNLAEAINETINDQIFPDLIVLQCMNDEFKKIRSACSSEKHIVIEQSLARMSTKTVLAIAAYDANGVCSEVELISKKKTASLEQKKADLLAYLRANGEKIIQAGLKELFSEKHIKLEAPSGFTFIKPSGDKATVFLKTEEALTETERVQYLAFSLLPRLAKRDTEFSKPVETIYIDSMAISSVAYALRDLYKSKHKNVMPRIVSFHSHDGLNNRSVSTVGRLLEHNSYCIISASTSLRLQRDWMEKTSCSQDEVITLLTLEDAKDANTALYRLPKDNPELADGEEQLRDIRIVGERFQPDQLQPKKVILREPCHKVKLTLLAKNIKAKEIFKVQVAQANATGRTHPIFVLTETLVKDDSFRKWIDKILLQYVSASTCTLVVQNDSSSKILSDVLTRRAKSLNIPVKWQRIFDDEIEEKSSKIHKENAMLVVAGVIGKGSRLLSISRDLRDIHAGARLYVVGFQVAETHEQIKRLSQNLMFSAVKAHISIERFSEMAIGIAIADSFKRESKLVDSSALGMPSIIDRTRKIAGSIAGMGEDAFFPATSGSPLELRPDFAYWTGVNYKPGAKHAPWILAMVASILQRAREEKSLEDDDRLATDAFQHVVLDPENFSRYNDGIIQAAILRAAYSSELDYSCSEELSDAVRIFIEKVFGSSHLNQGEAALEFAVAIRTGKLRLKKEHLVKLTNFVNEKKLDVIKKILQGELPNSDMPI
ncbi:MAG: hypothetical protein K8R50_11165 [Betaproteobacteria bacterium]|nr:hypothetical protein [Betaproteobacteria bacterium]